MKHGKLIAVLTTASHNFETRARRIQSTNALPTSVLILGPVFQSVFSSPEWPLLFRFYDQSPINIPSCISYMFHMLLISYLHMVTLNYLVKAHVKNLLVS
jgi:hypothetical protein